MTAVAEGLIGAFPAAAKRDTVSDFVGRTVSALDRNAAAHPDRAAHPSLRVFDQHDFRLEFRLDLDTLFFPDDKTPRGTVPRFFNCDFPRFRIVRFCDKLPDAAGAVAECGVGAERAGVSQVERRAFNILGLFEIRLFTAVSIPLKFTSRCVPSQKGLFLERPQRQRA